MTSSCESYIGDIKETSLTSGLFSSLEKNRKDSNSKIIAQFQLRGSFLKLRFMSSFPFKPLNFPSVAMRLSVLRRENRKDKYCFRICELSLQIVCVSQRC